MYRYISEQFHETVTQLGSRLEATRSSPQKEFALKHIIINYHSAIRAEGLEIALRSLDRQFCRIIEQRGSWMRIEEPEIADELSTASREGLQQAIAVEISDARNTMAMLAPETTAQWFLCTIHRNPQSLASQLRSVERATTRTRAPESSPVC